MDFRFFNLGDVSYRCIQYDDILHHFYKYLLHKLTIGDLCIYLVHDNEYIRNLAKEVYYLKTNNYEKYPNYYEAKLLFKVLWEERTRLWIDKRCEDSRLTTIDYIRSILYNQSYYYLKEALLNHKRNFV